KQHRADKPFFCYLATNCQHTPLEVRDEDLALYADQDLSNARFPQKIGHKLPAKTDTSRVARIYGMITNIDDNVGRLRKALDAEGLTRNTIVIFMVDNGPAGPARYNAGMRGLKTEVREGGIHSPFFVRWPARLKAGHSSDRIAAHIDVLPTVLEACGVAPPADLKLDGRSLLPLLEGEKADWPDRTLFTQSHRGNEPILYHNFAARTQKWKLLNNSGFGKEGYTGPYKFELYDMASDPLEMDDVAADHPDIVADLRKEYEAWFRDVSSTRGYAPPRIPLGTPHEDPVMLTWQDWRQEDKGKGWERKSCGHWKVTVARPGTYQFRLRFRSPVFKDKRSDNAGTVELRIGDQVSRKEKPAGTYRCQFDDIVLRRGDMRIEAILRQGKTTISVYQIDVHRIGGGDG
ncbi:MAG: sulfatase-like hydrolase/transferase, partial [Pirellulales bacterium]